ncbi:hypothetical protein BU23DRAFT_585796 [Bimuria novae-zelandiae CBS 107.79]|uniref:DUF8021 domain-containing protein n=1 Tax=Bimuria novae-zelandiae CBS 107.79 TaxID=1447943 RepID=A0A6A5UJN6_9PLEO|nr:hypothetical protein BU23DRAFT_585796 [Bimuria novae-zelandiae CBS 107.79]
MLHLPTLFLVAFVAHASAACTREQLTAATADLLKAQTAGTLSGAASFAPSIKYTENRKTVNITKGILSQPLVIAHNRSQHDISQCAAFSEFIITNPSKPYVLATQLRLDNATQKVAQIDTIATTKGDWLFNVTGTYYWASRESWTPIPATKRDTREAIKAAADAYCDIFNDKNVKVSWGTPCARLEGGAYTGKGEASDRCDVGIPSGVKLVNRQYVIDEEYGTVDFRLEGGKIRYVHTLSSCGGKSCM